jgi:hypothetical protein
MRHTEGQIIAILKQSSASTNIWKESTGGMDSGDAMKVRQLEDENRENRTRAGRPQLMLENQNLKDVLSKNF